jgi:hypothetical protein
MVTYRPVLAKLKDTISLIPTDEFGLVVRIGGTIALYDHGCLRIVCTGHTRLSL